MICKIQPHYLISYLFPFPLCRLSPLWLLSWGLNKRYNLLFPHVPLQFLWVVSCIAGEKESWRGAHIISQSQKGVLFCSLSLLLNIVWPTSSIRCWCLNMGFIMGHRFPPSLPWNRSSNVGLTTSWVPANCSCCNLWLLGLSKWLCRTGGTGGTDQAHDLLVSSPYNRLH